MRFDRVCKSLSALAFLLALAAPAAGQGTTTHTGTVRITSTASDALCVGGSGVTPSSCAGGVKAGSMTNAGLTPTRIVFSSTAGLLSDDADLTFDGTALTATKLFVPGNTTGVAGLGGTTYSHVLVAVGRRTSKSDPNPNLLTEPHQVGVYSNVDGNSYVGTGVTGAPATDGYVIGFESALGTDAGSGTTTPWVVSYSIGAIYKATGNTITRTSGINFVDETVGDNNAAITTFNSTFTGNWFIHYDGTRPSKLAGNLQVGAEVFRTSDTSYLRFASNSTAGGGANMVMYGSSHATNASELYLNAANGIYLGNNLHFGGAESYRTVDNSYFRLAGGNTVGGGATLLLYGASHATNPTQAFLSGTGGITVTGPTYLSNGYNFKIGGSASRGTTSGTNQLALFNGTAPVGTLTNGVSLYSSSGDLYAMNALGAATKLTAAGVFGAFDTSKTCDTDYTAATDLLVMVNSDASGAADISTESHTINAGGGGIAHSGTMGVRKGQTWRVSLSGGTCGTNVVILVLPIGG